MTKRKQEIFASHVSIAGGIVIFLISLAAGLAADSMTLLLDASTGLVIVLVAVFVRIIVEKINKPPDQTYNFGYEKYEPLTVLIQNIAILVTCLVGLKFAIQDIIHSEEIANYNFASYSIFACAIIAALLGVYLRKVSFKTNSGVLKTSAMHWFIDSSFSLGICAGFLFAIHLEKLGLKAAAGYVDPVMAIILALLMMRLPLNSITANFFELLDAFPDRNTYEKIRKVAQNYMSHFAGISRLRCRKAGRKTFVDICFLASGNLTVKETEELAKRFESDISAVLPNCDCVVYFKQP